MSTSKSVRDLRSLSKREKQLLTSLERVEEFITNYEDERDGRQLNIRLTVLESVYREFCDVRTQIELMLEDVEVTEESEEDDLKAEEGEAAEKTDAEKEREKRNMEVYGDFEDRYCVAQSFLSEKLKEKNNLTTPATENRSLTNAEPTFSKVKLPEIRLPTFSGKLREWVPFRDSFRSLIHSNTQLTDMDRFSYLKSGLSGDALREIESVELSAANYPVAWKALETRYENKKLIVKAHLDALFAVERMKRESFEGLNQLISEFEKNLQMMDKIGENTAAWSTILAHMLYSRLDAVTMRNWETHHNSKEVPKFKDMLEYLKNYCSVLQSVVPAKSVVVEQQRPPRSVCHTTVKSTNKCPFCSGPSHSPFMCGNFRRMKVHERNEAVLKNKLCRNCLNTGHISRVCDRGACRICSERHHTMLHGAPVPRSSVPQSQTAPQTQNSAPRQPHPNQQTHTTNTATPTNSQNPSTQSATSHPSTSQTHVALPITPTQNVLLSTALVKVKDRYGNSMLARALLDSCSQHCLMTKDFASKLKFRESPAYLSIQGIGTSSCTSTKLVSAVVSPRISQISPFVQEMQFHVLPRLTVSLPTATFEPSGWKFPKSAILADPRFYETGPVDMIIGAEYYLDLLKKEQQKATEDGPTLQNTEFGWIVSGRIPSSPISESCSVVHVCSTADLHEQLTKFWELETCRTASTLSIEEAECEEFFDKTTIRDKTGRFVVSLPKKEVVINQLGDSRTTAVKRFMGIERRFAANAELKKLYADFIHEYLAMGHMKDVTGEVDAAVGKVYYLPHHAVLKPDSTTTKLRVVFDGSCQTSTGFSLNDGLKIGPVVQEDLLSTTLRFRIHRYALVADIAKMYRMIQVQDADQPLQRIVWRDSPDEPLRTFNLTTVTYGTASAPYLATKCLQRLAEEGRETHPVASKVLKKDFYVDDMLSGVDDIDQGRLLVKEMIDLLQSAGFPLRKWNSNSRELLADIPENLRDERTLLELESSTAVVKTLGLSWEPSSDSFRFSSPSFNTSHAITKRIVVSDASRLFDPLGLVGPVVILAKLFIQELWKQNRDWDEPLEKELQEFWLEFRRNLAALDSLSVPRWVGFSSSVVVELHGFCDASVKAYGACLYVRTVSANAEVSVQLLTAKSRVAPLENLKRGKKEQSIPRLELASALLLSHLFEKVSDSIRINARSFFWTDSMIVKCWISSPPSRWKQFIANRVSEIQHGTRNGVWNHVAGIENPADIISRGMTPAQLQYQSLWFNGPNWLQLDESHWPTSSQISEADINPADLEERAITALAPASTPSEVFSLRSSWTELVRLVAHLRRFTHNLRPANRNCRKLGFLSRDEQDAAMKSLIRLAQRESFPQEVADMSNGRPVRDSSRIASLHPQFEDGILCVGGRLRHATVPNTRKHPYILDHKHPLTKTIVRHFHRRLFHAGQQLLVSAVREQFWPISARNIARQVIRECVDCFRAKPRVQDQLMADLPPERVTPCTPFQRVAVDYCGPFSVKYPIRGNRPVKVFVAVYVCLVTKAVHLDLATDLSTQAFLRTLFRFAGHRGTPEIIMCDNGRNFVGARRELDELRRLFNNQQFRQDVVKQASAERIEFRFIPARSPNFGGLWESAVKSFKTHFKRTIGSHVLMHDEFLTVLAQVEAVLNSRPLTPISNDPGDYEALTPGHFLIHRPLTAIPEPDLDNIPENRLSAWQQSQKYVQQLWKKWSTHYLSDLNNRTKWTKAKDNVGIGTMVILKDENLPPLKWQLGRVTDVHPGEDGKVRVVTVKTKDGSYRRAISKICVLPIRDNIVLPDGE